MIASPVHSRFAHEWYETAKEGDSPSAKTAIEAESELSNP